MERKRRSGPHDALSEGMLFYFIELIMPRTRIAKGLGAVIDLRAFIVIQILLETDLSVRALELINIVFIVRVFHMEFLAAADRAFGLAHR
jgi:hypothetical protein